MILMPHLRTWFAATIVALAATPLIAASLPVTVERFEGEVVQVDGTVHSGVLPGKTLPSGSQIHTGKDGRAQLLLHGAPTLAVGTGADLLLHSMDGDVLRLRIASGALRIDTRAAPGVPARDVRLNAGDLRLRVSGADAWIEMDPDGGQVCLIAGVVEAQQPGATVRLDAPGQCLRQSGRIAQWSMVPIAVLEERVALLRVSHPVVALAPPPPRPQIKALPLPAEAQGAGSVTPAQSAAPAAASMPTARESGTGTAAMPPPMAQTPAAPAPPPAASPPKIEIAVEKVQAAPAAATSRPVKPAAAGPVPQPPADPHAPAAAQGLALAQPGSVEVAVIADPPKLWQHVPPVIVIPAPAETAAETAAGTPAETRAETRAETPAATVTPEAAEPAVTAAAATASAEVVEAAPPADVPAPALPPAAGAMAVAVAAAEALPVADPVIASRQEPAADATPPTPAADPVQVAAAAPAGSEAPADDPRRWRVVLGSMPEPEKAEIEAERLNARGWAVDAREYRVGDRHGYRIGFGDFSTRDEAQKALEEFVAQYPEAPAWLARY